MDIVRTCNKCSSDLVVQRGKYAIHAYCPDCFEEQYVSRSNGNCCYAPKIEPVKVMMQGGGFQIRQQCDNCGYSFGLALKKSDFDLSKVKLRDENKQKEFFELIAKEQSEFQAKYLEYRKQNYTVENKFPGYRDYMNSDLWKSKRELVFKRDNYLCQSCLKNKAEQVHHLTYRHVFNEPLFDLVSVCVKCHDIITNMDRGNDTEKL